MRRAAEYPDPEELKARILSRPPIEGTWEVRHNLSPYDAAYVAPAEALDAPLVTCDGRLSRAPGHRARLELI